LSRRKRTGPTGGARLSAGAGEGAPTGPGWGNFWAGLGWAAGEKRREGLGWAEKRGKGFFFFFFEQLIQTIQFKFKFKNSNSN